jgi:hypothetical protein
MQCASCTAALADLLLKPHWLVLVLLLLLP